MLETGRSKGLLTACLNIVATVLTFNKVEVNTLVQYEQLVTTMSSWLLTSTSLSLVQLTEYQENPPIQRLGSERHFQDHSQSKANEDPVAGKEDSLSHYSSIRGSWNMKFVGARLRGGVQDSPAAPILPEANTEKEDMFAESEGDEVSPETNVERKRRQSSRGASSRWSSRSQSSGEDDVICECGQRFGRKSSLVRHRNINCSLKPDLNMNLPTGTRRKDKKRPSAPSPQLTPRTSGAKRLVVRDDDVSVSSETLVTYEEDGMTAKLLKC